MDNNYAPPKADLKTGVPEERWSFAYSAGRIFAAVVVGTILLEFASLVPNEVAGRLGGAPIRPDKSLNSSFVMVQLPGLLLTNFFCGVVIAKIAGRRLLVSMILVLLLVVAREAALYFISFFEPRWYVFVHAATVLSALCLGALAFKRYENYRAGKRLRSGTADD